MVHRLSRMRGFHMLASDGEIGHVDDFVVDPKTWQIRYLVVDTSNWIGGHWVAVSPASVTRFDSAGRAIHLALTRDEVKSSPPLEDTEVPPYELTRFTII